MGGGRAGLGQGGSGELSFTLGSWTKVEQPLFIFGLQKNELGC